VLKKGSYALNIFFAGFFFWYFFIHVGINYYAHRFIHNREFFREDVYYQEKVKSYSELNALLDNTRKYRVIVGDSIIEHFPINELFHDIKILNRGIGKDTSLGLLDRVDVNINNINISSCFVMIGHNDLKYRTESSTINIIKQVLRKIKSDKIYFLSILPDQDEYNNAIVADINSSVKEFCKNGSCSFIDFYEMFIQEGYSYRENYYYDGVHLTVDGYKAMAEHLEDIIEDNTAL
jgi:lysophospholipase L1-like esterase